MKSPRPTGALGASPRPNQRRMLRFRNKVSFSLHLLNLLFCEDKFATFGTFPGSNIAQWYPFFVFITLKDCFPRVYPTFLTDYFSHFLLRLQWAVMTSSSLFSFINHKFKINYHGIQFARRLFSTTTIRFSLSDNLAAWMMRNECKLFWMFVKGGRSRVIAS